MRNNDAQHPAAMPEAKDADEQARIIAEHTHAVEVPTTSAPTEPAIQVVPPQKKVALIKLYEHRRVTSLVFIEVGTYPTTRKAIDATAFRRQIAALKDRDIHPIVFELKPSDLDDTPIAKKAVYSCVNETIYSPFSYEDPRGLQQLYIKFKETFGTDLSNPLALSICLHETKIHTRDDILNLNSYLFGHKYGDQNWHRDNRKHLLDFIEAITDPIIGEYYRDAEAFGTFSFINTHLELIDEAKRPRRKIVPIRVNHIASFLFGLGSKATQGNRIMQNFEVCMLSESTLWHYERGIRRNTSTCLFIEIATLCFNKYETYHNERASAVRFFLKIYKALPKKERIAWLGVTKTQQSSNNTLSSFSALYYIALNCRADEFQYIVNFPLKSQPHLLDDAFKAAVQQNPGLLPSILHDLEPVEIFQMMQRCFTIGSKSASEHLPRLIHEHYAASYEFYEDYENNYVYGYHASTANCLVDIDKSPADLVLFLLNLPIKKQLPVEDIHHWDIIVKLCLLPDEHNPTAHFQLAISHHYNAKTGSLRTLIDSFISVALHKLSHLMQQYPEQLVKLAMPIIQHGKQRDQRDVLIQFIDFAVSQYDRTGECDFIAASQLIALVDTKTLYKVEEAYNTIPSTLYFDLLVAIRDPAKRLTVFAELYYNAPREFFNEKNVSQLIDLLREDIAHIKCNALQQATINALGKFFHPFSRELFEGETPGFRIDTLMGTAEAGTMVLCDETRTDKHAQTERAELAKAASTPSDFKKGYLIAALVNFKRNRVWSNDFHDPTNADAPSHQLAQRIFQLPSLAASGTSEEATTHNHRPDSCRPDQDC
ncbi:MAG: hypothetical protein P1U34_09375 [Coxiellaceae bacterium]|nr:hypothetical protein [Coxiellaceae bacterium]